MPKVHYEGQEGPLEVAISPHFATDRMNVVEGSDGALWIFEDEDQGRLLKLTPRK